MYNYPDLIYQYHNTSENYDTFYLRINVPYNNLFDDYDVLTSEDNQFSFKIFYFCKKPNNFMDICIEATHHSSLKNKRFKINYKRIY